jgi:hypothetical protein
VGHSLVRGDAPGGHHADRHLLVAQREGRGPYQTQTVVVDDVRVYLRLAVVLDLSVHAGARGRRDGYGNPNSLSDLRPDYSLHPVEPSLGRAVT